MLLVVQVAGAIAFGSVALLADSVHQASDVFSLVMAVGIAAVVIRPASRRYTFGLGRADALGGLAHAVLLLGGALLIVVEALRRLTADGGHEVDGLGVVILATAGLLVNGFSARWLHVGHHGHHGHDQGHDHGVQAHHHPSEADPSRPGHAEPGHAGPGHAEPGHAEPGYAESGGAHAAPASRSLNVEGAILHLVADALGSLVVLIGGAVVLLTDADWVDPAASLVVTVLIVWSAVRLFAASLHVLLDGVPVGVDLEELRAVLVADPMVTDAHHLHVRTLGGEALSLTGHVRVDSDQLHDAETVTRRLSTALAERGITHVTLQAECHPCAEPEC